MMQAPVVHCLIIYLLAVEGSQRTMFYVHIGTTNEAKTHAIRNVFEAYRLLPLTTASRGQATSLLLLANISLCAVVNR